MRLWRLTLVVFAGVLAASACARPKPAAPDSTPNLQPRLDAANALVRVGCFDCLAAALAEYDVIRTFAGAPAPIVESAATGAVRAALLLELRERELGTTDDGYLARAEKILGTISGPPDAARAFAAAIDLVDAVPWPVSRARQAGAAQVERMRRLYQERQAWKALFLGKAADNEFSAYLWLTFACESGEARVMSKDDLAAPLGAMKDAPLIVYKGATCPRMETKALGDLQQREPRFAEIDYFMGVKAILDGRLEDADQMMERAYSWHSKWPEVTQTLASVALTAEDFDRALRFYDETLTLAPGHAGALFGRVQSLSYLGRHEEAIQAADTAIAAGSHRGDAYYWRAWNDLQLNRLDQAWADIQASEKLLVNAAVAKLAGMIAYRREQLEVARAKFEQGYKMKSGDCEIGFYLGIVDAELRRWAPSADVFIEIVACLQENEQRLTQEIAKIEASKATAERKARQIAKRRQQLRNGARMMATSWFNTAVAYFNLSQKAEARQYAEKVSTDEQFGERARELLSRLDKQP
jgi:tetratricopeptide (TPR) repeat protein